MKMTFIFKYLFVESCQMIVDATNGPANLDLIEEFRKVAPLDSLKNCCIQ